MNKHRLGVVAVVPFWSQSDNMNVDSNYAYLRVVLPEMQRQTEDTLFLMFFPDPNYGNDKWTYKNDGLQNERIIFYPWNYDTQMSTSVTGWDSVRFAKLEKEFGPSIYWLHQVESGAFVHAGYHNSYANVTRPAIIAQHHYIIHQSLPYELESMFSRRWLQMGGSVAAHSVIYNSEHCRQMARESFSDYMNADAMIALEEKSQTFKFGLISGNEPISEPATPSSKPIFLYNHRFEYYKRPDITFGIFDELRAKYDFEVWASQTPGQAAGGGRQYRYDKSIFEPSRDDYLAKIAIPAINTINSKHETFCISILDSMAAGHLIVAPDDITFPELLPDDYPYLFKNENEQRAMLVHLLENFEEEFNRWREPIAEHARKNFNLAEYVADYLDEIALREEQHRSSKRKPNTLQGIHAVFNRMQKNKPISAWNLRRNIAIELYGGASGTQSMPTRRAIREALALRDDIRIEFKNGVKLYRE